MPRLEDPKHGASQLWTWNGTAPTRLRSSIAMAMGELPIVRSSGMSRCSPSSPRVGLGASTATAGLFRLVSEARRIRLAHLFDPVLAVHNLEDAPKTEIEAAEQEILDQATGPSTISGLQAEIATLSRLERLAAQVRPTNQDTKWRELPQLLIEIPAVGRSSISDLERDDSQTRTPADGPPSVNENQRSATYAATTGQK